MRVAFVLLVACSCLAGAAVAGPAADPTRLPAAPFPGPASAPSPATVGFTPISSRVVGVDVSTPASAPLPVWAAPTYDGKPLARAIRQPGTVLLLYGDEPTVLVGVSTRSHRQRYAFDLSALATPPDRSWLEPIVWARERKGVLYVSTSHLTYASETRLRNAYVNAIDLRSRKLLWRSAALVANARTFVVTDDVIVSGYGFTAEPDFVYALDRKTGTVVGRAAVPNAPERIRLHGDRLTVRTYDRLVILRLTL